MSGPHEFERSSTAAPRHHSPVGIVQDLTHLQQERFGHQRLLNEAGARVEHTVAYDGVVRVAGHEQHLRTWPQWLEPLPELSTAHAGHHDIREQQMDVALVLFANQERVSARCRDQHVIAVSLQNRAGEASSRTSPHLELAKFAWVIPMGRDAHRLSTESASHQLKEALLLEQVVPEHVVLGRRRRTEQLPKGPIDEQAGDCPSVARRYRVGFRLTWAASCAVFPPTAKRPQHGAPTVEPYRQGIERFVAGLYRTTPLRQHRRDAQCRMAFRRARREGTLLEGSGLALSVATSAAERLRSALSRSHVCRQGQRARRQRR